MKKPWIGLLLMFGSMTALSASVDTSYEHNPLEVILTLPTSKREAESGIIIFTLRNRGKAPVYVTEPLTPFHSRDEIPNNAFFDIEDANGKQVRYTGVFACPSGSYNVLKLEPGVSRSKRVNLGATYDFGAGGPFKVKFSRYLIEEPDKSEEQRRLGPRAISNTLDVWINDGFLKAQTNAGMRGAKPAMSGSP